MRMIDLLLDKDVSVVETVKIPALVEEREIEYCEKDLFDIYIMTWRAPKKIPTSLPLIENSSNLIVIGIQ